MQVIISFFLLVCLVPCSGWSVLPEPYQSINYLPFDNTGWFVNEVPLKACLKEKHIKTVIEVGSWLGSSTRFIANNTPEDAIVYAVDTWGGSWTPSQKIYFENDPRVPYAYQLFLSNVKHANLAHKIIPVRMFSLEAATALNVSADLIYIDACHEEESVYNDIKAWILHLNPGGTMCGDDWQWDSVRRGVCRAAQELNLQVDGSGYFWKLY